MGRPELLLPGRYWAVIGPLILLGPCTSFSPPHSKEEYPWLLLRVEFFVARRGISPSSCYTGYPSVFTVLLFQFPPSAFYGMSAR
ncbi:UNVERIFIED_CONTAM: hypothetical protein Slati_1419600 [Sesamum latifolium]|uniref:Secreted protein n=1 Tax=Sesamum latifolium TaxID=2727402 RepID=A0AAW2X359_9LAMI